MNTLEYKLLYGSESYGNYGSFGIQISVAADTLPDLSADAIQNAAYKAVAAISAEVQAAVVSNDPRTSERTKVEREQLLGLFPEKIFYEAIPNGYCSDWCCRHLPWYIVTTAKGHFKIGWRKRVIEIDWSKTVDTKTAEELFPKENVTKGDKYIHAWTVKDAKKYIDTILEV